MGWGTGEWGSSTWGSTESDALPPPSLIDVSPGLVARRGGDVVTVVGEHFDASTKIEILSGNAVDGFVKEADGYIFDPDFDVTGNRLFFGSPALNDGTYHVKVITDFGDAILEDALTYELFAEEMKIQRVHIGFATVWKAGRRLLTTRAPI